MSVPRNNPFVTISQSWATYAPDGRPVGIRRLGTGWQVDVDGCDQHSGTSLTDLLALAVGVGADDEWTARRKAEKALPGPRPALPADRPSAEPRPAPRRSAAPPRPAARRRTRSTGGFAVRSTPARASCSGRRPRAGTRTGRSPRRLREA